VAGVVLGLNAFLLAFTFSTVADRYQDRKALVRDDANAIRVAYVARRFPAAGRSRRQQAPAQGLSRTATGFREGCGQPARAGHGVVRKRPHAAELWRIAVANARLDMNSDVAALYIESLNDIASVHTNRLAKGVRARVPLLIWIALFGLTALGMVSMGYQTGLAGSKRSKATSIVAVSFAMVIALVAALDRPDLVQVSQQPLLDLQAFMTASDDGA
jgi:hypothetical protein